MFIYLVHLSRGLRLLGFKIWTRFREPRSELSDQVPPKGSKKMGKTGRLYSPEFKEEAIRLRHSSEERYPVAKIARDLDVSAETLRNKWVKSRPRSTQESVKGSQPKRDRNCAACAKRGRS